MRWLTFPILAALALGLASSATAQGILVVTDGLPLTGGVRDCLVQARKALSGGGLVLQTSGASVYGSNDDRTVSIRCDIPNIVLFVSAFVPGVGDQLDLVEDAFKAGRSVPLIPARTKGHQYTVDCTRQTSCVIEPAAICRQAYPTSKKPSAKILSRTPCADAQGSYTCSIDYDLNCE